MAAFALPLALAALSWPFVAATLPEDTCDSGDRCSMSLLQTGSGARRTAALAAPGEAVQAAGVAAAPALGGSFAELDLSEEEAQAVFLGQRHRNLDPIINGIWPDMNGHMCALCNAPMAERADREYKMRTDCGNHSLFRHPMKVMLTPLITFSREATATQPATNAWCELNSQKMCADALYNRDFLYQAKAVNYPRFLKYDPWYCFHNGWLEPEIVALQHDFEGMEKKSKEMCHSEKYAHTGWNTTMTVLDMSLKYSPGTLRGWPTKEEAIFVGAWTCAMGSSGCDMAYCAYSFCKLPNGELGSYDQCEGWDPKKGMPVPAAAR